MWSVDHGLEGFLAFALEGTSLLHNFSFCKSFLQFRFSRKDSPYILPEGCWPATGILRAGKGRKGPTAHQASLCLASAGLCLLPHPTVCGVWVPRLSSRWNHNIFMIGQWGYNTLASAESVTFRHPLSIFQKLAPRSHPLLSPPRDSLTLWVSNT